MSARGLGTLTLDLIAKIGGFTGPMDEAARKAKKTGKDIAGAADGALSAWQELGPAIAGAFAGLSIGTVFTAFITNTKAMEQEQAQLEAALKSTGGAAGYSSDQLNSMAEAMSNASTFSGGEINTAQTALLAFTGIAGEEFKKATQSAIDMAARTGMSVVSAAETIGRALDVPSKGMAALSKQGFRFTDDQKALAKSLEESGRTAEAQGIILQELQKSYGGAAEAARDTFGGALLGLGNTLADITTGDKDSLAAAKAAVEGLISALKSPAGKIAIEALAASAVALSVVLATRVAASAAASAISFAMAQKEAIRYQSALATMAGLSTRAAIGVASVGAAARAASAGMALLGGPAGLVILAASSLVYFATRASETEVEAAALEKRIDSLGGSFEGLGQKQAAAALIDYTKLLDEAKFAASTAEAKVFSLNKRLKENPGSPAVQGLKVDLARAEGALEKANEKVVELTASVEQLNAKANSSTIGTMSDLASKTFNDLSAKIQEQIDLHGKETGAAQLAARIQLGYIKDLKEGEGDKLIALQRVADAQAAGDKAQKEREAEGKRQVEQARNAAKAIASTVQKYEEQAVTLGMNSTALAIFKLEQDGATQAQIKSAKSALDAVSAYEAQAKAMESYKNLVLELRTPSEVANDQLKSRIKTLREARLSNEEYAASLARVSAATVTEAPNFEGLDPSVGGPSGELLKVAEASGELERWREDELQKQKDYLDQKELNEQQYADNVANIMRQSNERTASIQAAWQVATLSTFAGVTGDAAAMLGELGGKSSALYKTMFLASKAASIAQAVINTELAAVRALAELGPIAGPPMAATMRGLGYVSVGIMAGTALMGMAHEGMGSIPSEGTWLLDGGERVVAPKQNQDLTNFLARQESVAQDVSGSAGGGGVVIHTEVTVQAQPGATQTDAKMTGDVIASMVEDAVREGIRREMGQGGLLWRRV